MAYFLYNVLLILASPIILLILLAKNDSARHSATPGMVSTGSRRFHCYHGDYLGTCRFLGRSRRGGTARAEHPCAISGSPNHRDHRHRNGARSGGATISRYCRTSVYALGFPWVVAAVSASSSRVSFSVWKRSCGRICYGRWRGGRTGSLGERSSLVPIVSRLPVHPAVDATMLASVTHSLLQSRRDAERITALGAPAERVICTGNIKFDQPLPHLQDTDADSLRALLLAGQEDLLVAGSTHPGEEDQVLACYQRVSSNTRRLYCS